MECQYRSLLCSSLVYLIFISIQIRRNNSSSCSQQIIVCNPIWFYDHHITFKPDFDFTTRLYLAECITREKTYMASNLYLKFSELQLLDDGYRPFSNIYDATASAVLTEFMSLQEIIAPPEGDLLRFLAGKSRNRIAEISRLLNSPKRQPGIPTGWTSTCTSH